MKDEREPVAAGLLSIPKKPFDLDRFWEIGSGVRAPKISRRVLQRAMAATREDLNVGKLGSKRRPAPVRSGASKKSR